MRNLLFRLIASASVARFDVLFRSPEYADIELDLLTLADWVGKPSRILQALVDARRKYVMGAEKLHGDDMPVGRAARACSRRESAYQIDTQVGG